MEDLQQKSIDATKTSTYTESYTDSNPAKNNILDSGASISDEKINVSPQLFAYYKNNQIPINYYIKTMDMNAGAMTFDQSTIKADGISWQKAEIYLNTVNYGTSNYIDSIVMNLNVFSQMINSGFNISPIWLYPITEFDYYQNKYFPSESVFSGRRPGEALLNPFLSPLSTTGINYYTDLTSGQTSDSPRSLTYSFMNPQNIIDIPENYQLIPSIYDKYQYYISDSGSIAGISAFYDQYLTVNKIYVKIANQISNVLPSNSSSLILYYNDANGKLSSSLVNGPFLFDNNGISVFYFLDGKWGNTSGLNFSASVKNSASTGLTTGGWLPPRIQNNGQIQSNQLFTSLTGLKLIVPYTSSYSSTNLDDSRLHVVEISPRLEIDVTDYLESYSFDKELDRGDTSANFPMGYITSNNGSIKLNNFPVIYNNQAFTIFENKSPQSTFYDLLRQGVKFTGYFWSPPIQRKLYRTDSCLHLICRYI
jgi:hypothetical protein